MDLNKTEAGLELDALVAEKVMGWTYVEKQGPFNYSGDRVTEPYFCWRGMPPNHAGTCEPPRYSLDIAAAWDIIDVVRQKTDRAFFLQNVAGRWVATFRFILGGRLDCDGYADTAPLAICRAALIATE